VDGDRRQSASRAINVVVQDRKNRNLLVIGNDIGVFVSVDAGARWSQLKANLPTVAVHDLTIHPRENDLVIGTYGRALWTGDITPLQELSAEVMDKARVSI
jgi:ligand-binding sensor domain-containing protein